VPYVEFLPDPSLAHLIKCVWNYEASTSERDGRPERIVPDGNPELVVHYGHPFSDYDETEKKQLQPRVFMMGQMTRPLALDSSHGAPGIMGVRFHPAGSRAMVGAAMDEFTDQRLDVADLAPREARTLHDEIASAPGAAARAAVMQRFVRDFVDANARFQDPMVMHWTRQLQSANGRLSIARLADEADMSVRQLERRFRLQVGIPPRQYANVVRFRAVFDMLTGDSKPDWIGLALDAGYFDQSHMIRDFKRFLGCSPTTFVNQLRGLSAVLVGLDEETACRVITRRDAAS
jgi:AraC-like DNA-binding protein